MPEEARSLFLVYDRGVIAMRTMDYQINHSFSIVVIISGKKERNIEHWSRKTNQYFCN